MDMIGIDLHKRESTVHPQARPLCRNGLLWGPRPPVTGLESFPDQDRGSGQCGNSAWTTVSRHGRNACLRGRRRRRAHAHFDGTPVRMSEATE
jgi:hypothetical protein